MAYKALYRTYRPQSFSEIIGQETIVKTLQNEIKENKISHAYLFSGPRGTGKTSIARVFAKALNCQHLVNGEPCNECSNCKEITEGVNPDVIEIDAASNNGVDEIRAMKDRIGFLPAGSKYKIYIIDEVHMLSTSAFNAFLKTLEEPPKHVIFILATTEPQKILSTVLSRCQRYDFKSLTAEEILDVLEKVCVSENVDYDKEALLHIAKASDGGLRDALSFLDQAVSFCGDKITDDDASSVTGTVGKEKLIALTKAMKDKNLPEAMNLLNELQNSGKEVSKIVTGLLEFYRDILMIKNIKDSKVDSRYIEYANSSSFEEIFYYIDVLSDVQNKIKYASSTSIYLQVAIIRIINTSATDLDYQKRISVLEDKINNIGSGNVEAVNSVDNNALKELEGQYNNLLAYLNKLGIQTFAERIKTLENNQLQIKSNNNKEFESKLYKVIEDLELLKVTYSSMRNAVDNASVGGISDEELNEKFEEVAKKYKPSINYTEIESFVKKQIDSIMNEVRNAVVNEVKKDTVSVVTEKVLEDVNSLITSNKPSEEPNQETVQIVLEEVEKIIDEKSKDINQRTKNLEEQNEKLQAKAKELEELTKNLDNKENTVLTPEIQERIVETKEVIIKPEGLSEELETRLVQIEDKIYTLMNDLLQRTQSNNKKSKHRVDEKQISFWGGDIIDNDKVNNQANKSKASFEGLDEKLLINNLDKESSNNSNIEDTKQTEQENQIIDTDNISNELDVNDESNIELDNESNLDNNEQEQNLFDDNDIQFEEIQEDKQDTNDKQDINLENISLEDGNVYQNDISSEDDDEINLFDDNEKDSLLDDNLAKEKLQVFTNKQRDEIKKREREREVAEILINKRKEKEIQINSINIDENISIENDINNQYEEKSNEQLEDNNLELSEINEEQKELENNSNYDEIDLKQEEFNLFGKFNQDTNVNEDLAKSDTNKLDIDKEDLDEYEQYNVKVLERILNDSREKEYSGEKERILSLWKNLIELAPSDKRGTAEILVEGQVRAVGNHEFVLTYETARMCNQVMSRKFKKNSLKLLYDLLGEDYNYLAITTDQWTLKRQEYVDQYVIGVKYPKLTAFTDPNLKVVIVEDEEEKTKRKIIDIFGPNVKFKKE